MKKLLIAIEINGHQADVSYNTADPDDAPPATETERLNALRILLTVNHAMRFLNKHKTSSHTKN